MSRQPRVQFEAQLAVPPANRPRSGVMFPSVAQQTGKQDRMCNDLNWAKYCKTKLRRSGSEESSGDEEGTRKHGRSTTKAPNTSLPLRNILSAACEALVEKTVSFRRSSSMSTSKPTRPNLSLNLIMPMPCEHAEEGAGDGESVYLSAPSSAYTSTASGSNSGASSEVTTPSEVSSVDARPWQ